MMHTVYRDGGAVNKKKDSNFSTLVGKVLNGMEEYTRLQGIFTPLHQRVFWHND